MTGTATAANDNPADAPSQRIHDLSAQHRPASQSHPLVRIIHDEALALTGLATVFRDNGCRVAMSDIDGVTSDPDPGQTPDICILGNLDRCDVSLVKRLRQNWPGAHIILFDLGIADDADFRDSGTRCRWLGLDDCLPAYSSKRRLRESVGRIIARYENRPDGAPRHVERMS